MTNIIPIGYQKYTPYTDLEDIRQMMMTKARIQDNYYSDFTIINFRKEDDLDGINDGKPYYEVYEIKITVTHDDAEDNDFSLTEQIVTTERRIKEYKTLKGLLQGAVNHVKKTENLHDTFTYLELN